MTNSIYKKVSLGDVCDLYQPKTITSKQILKYGKYKVYGANGVIGYYDQYNHEDEQVCITCRGATCGTINFSEAFSWITGNSMVAKPKTDNLNKLFLKYALIGSDFSKVISGSAQPQITRTNLSPLQIPLPPIDDQQKIVDKIEELFSVIDVNIGEIKKLIIETETYRASWLERLFNNVQPSSNLITFPELFELSQNGISKRSGTTGINTVVVRLADISDQKLDLTKTRSILLDQNEIEKYKLSENDLLCIRVNGSTNFVGRMILCNRLDGDIAFCDHFIRFRLKQPYLAEWVQMYMNTSKMRKFVQLNKVSSAGQNTISQSTLARICVPVPERKTVEQAYLEYEEISSKVAYLNNLLQMTKIKTNQLKQSILKQAFEGKLV